MKQNDPGIEAVDLADQAIREWSQSIDSFYLIRPMPPVGMKDDLLETNLTAIETNAARAKDCRVRLNGLIDIITDKQPDE